jgi:hypothetical protein
MPTLTTQYVYFGSSGGHTRQPRATPSYGGFTPIPGLNPSGTATLATSTPFQPGPAEATLTVGALNLAFAFTSVSGCTEGGLTSFVASTPPPVGTVGANPILVLYVYVPVGGGGGAGSTGAVIDAFNETTGSLVDNSFVTVSPDSGGSLTNEANVDGWVDTDDSAFTITADHPNIGAYMALPTSATFVQWVDLLDPAPPTTLISGANLTPGEKETVYALAFYKNPAVKTTKELVYDKNPKERVKEIDKEHYKEFPDKVPIDVHPGGKTIISDFPGKGVKDTVENPGSGGGVVDPPEFAGELRRLSERLSKLESSMKSAPKGAAFIKKKDRPPVGVSKQRKTRDH